MQERIIVRTEGDGGPFILVERERAASVGSHLIARGVDFTFRAHAVGNHTESLYCGFDRFGKDTKRVQRILDDLSN